MDTKLARTLCLKHVYEVALTDAEQALADDYAQTADGREYVRECREAKVMLKNVADVEIRPNDHKAMIESFERTVRQTFSQTVFRPRGEAYGPPIYLGLLAGFLIVLDGWSVINAVFLGACVLWLIATWFQRYFCEDFEQVRPLRLREVIKETVRLDFKACPAWHWLP